MFDTYFVFECVLVLFLMCGCFVVGYAAGAMSVLERFELMEVVEKEHDC